MNNYFKTLFRLKRKSCLNTKFSCNAGYYRVLFNLYFDDEYELLEDRMFAINDKDPPKIREVTDLLIKND